MRGFVRAAAIAGALLAWSASLSAAQDHRQLGAHQHGHGKLNLAIEGKMLEAELEVPGADIVGFEHEATSKADKDAVAAARKKLETATMVFGLPARAGCKLTSAKILLEGEDKAAGTAHHEEKHEGRGSEKTHSEFHVAYAFDCANAGALTEVTFPYFNIFPNAGELDVTLITSKGQKSFEVNRDSTRIDIRGLM